MIKIVVYPEKVHKRVPPPFGGWRWRMVSGNGRIIADSAEGYDSKGNAIRAAKSVIRTLERGFTLEVKAK